MRISDWSSYVCSSDLLRAPADNRSRVEAAGLVPTRDAPVDIGVRTQRVSGSDRGRPFPSVDALVERSHGTDRKSVVWGKSVSVRVVLGGRRFIKIKKPHKYIRCSQRKHTKRKR